MNANGNEDRVPSKGKARRVSRGFFIALAVGVGSHVAAVALLRVDPGPEATQRANSGFVSIVHDRARAGNLVVGEQLEYLNPEPLFMPTPWNAGVQPLPGELRRQPDQAFESFDPQMTFSSNQLSPIFVPPPVAVEEPLKALDLGASPRFAAVGRQEPEAVTLEREAFIEVRRVGDGAISLSGPVSGLPDTVRQNTWAPINFLVAVNDAGLVGSPMLEAGSGSTDIDDSIRTYLETDFRLGKRLLPGFYRVTVGP